MPIGTTALLWTAASVAVVGAGLGAYGAVSQGVAQQQMAEYNANVAQQQANMMQQQAEMQRTQAENEAIAKENDTRKQAQLQKRQQERIKSMNEARSGFGNTSITGSNLLAEIKSSENIESNYLELMRQGNDQAAQIRYQGEMNAYKSLLGSTEYTAQQRSYSQQANNASTSKYMNGVSAGFNGLVKGASLLKGDKK